MHARRRLLVLGAAALAWPLAGFAQQRSKPARIGYLIGGDASNFTFTLEPFKLGMRELGYVEGRDYVIEVRGAEGRMERNPQLMAELLQWKFDVIVTTNSEAAIAAQRATSTLPVVVANSADPVAAGLVKSLARPGGNVTGLSNLSPEVLQKQLELLRSALPRLSKVALLVNPENRLTGVMVKHIDGAAGKVGVEILRISATNAAEIEKAFAASVASKVQAVIVMIDALLVQQRDLIAKAAAKRRMPTMFFDRGHVEAGGLMSYGTDIRDLNRRAASYVDRILKGAKPGELPVEQPTKFEFALNLKTAKALGLAIPRELVLRADRVIE